jgi:hypothetical protein
MIRRRRLVVSVPLWALISGISATRAQDTPAAITPLRVLFIGSSLIYVNALPAVLSGLSAQSSETRKIEVEDVTFPDWTLARHWDSGKALSVIRGEHWDFVVLHPLGASDLRGKSTALFDAEIRKVGAKTIIFAKFPPIRSGQLDDPEKYVADWEPTITALGALNAPVGLAWMEAFKAGIPRSALYDLDGIHPTLAGTYVAACVFFAVIYGKSPEGLQPPWGQGQGSGAPDAAVLSAAAWTAVQRVQNAR